MVDVTPAISEDVDKVIKRALQEDIKTGDVTTTSIVGEHRQAHAVWKAKETGVVAGLPVGQAVFESLDPGVKWICYKKEGSRVRKGETIVEIHGTCRALLIAERTALNFVQRMSGVASKTHRFVQALKDSDTTILDTRKTAPGLRALDKWAVKIGGGKNHRMGLYDMAMIKDNHIIAAGTIANAVEKVRAEHPEVKVEVEAAGLAQVKEALSAGADIIMLDNMSLSQMEEAVTLVGDNAETEASGNISYPQLREIAATGVDYISAGTLTHSVQAFDISQQIQNIS